MWALHKLLNCALVVTAAAQNQLLLNSISKDY